MINLPVILLVLKTVESGLQYFWQLAVMLVAQWGTAVVSLVCLAWFILFHVILLFYFNYFSLVYFVLLVSDVYKGNVRSFQNTPTNVKRSIATFYSSGIMGKRKYEAVRVALSMKKSEKEREKRSSISIMHNAPFQNCWFTIILWGNLAKLILGMCIQFHVKAFVA